MVLLGAAAHCCTCAMRNKDRPVVSQSITVCVLGVKEILWRMFWRFDAPPQSLSVTPLKSQVWISLLEGMYELTGASVAVTDTAHPITRHCCLSCYFKVK